MSDTNKTADHDKAINDLQYLVNHKKIQLEENYNFLLKNVKSNPSLQAGIEEYAKYFKKDKETRDNQIKALKNILNSLDKNSSSTRNEIQREIKYIEKQL